MMKLYQDMIEIAPSRDQDDLEWRRLEYFWNLDPSSMYKLTSITSIVKIKCSSNATEHQFTSQSRIPLPTEVYLKLASKLGAYMPPPMISRKKKFFAQFLLHTQTTTQNRVTHQKPGLYLEQQKNGGRFKIAECNMTGSQNLMWQCETPETQYLSRSH